MFLYKGGNTVKKGTYWESEKNEKIVLREDGLLPGNNRDFYFRLPESYLLIPLFLLGLGLSVAFPYGVGFLAFIALIALMAAVYAASYASVRLFKEMLAKSATFGYAPTTAYMAGRKNKKTRKEKVSKDDATEEEK